MTSEPTTNAEIPAPQTTIIPAQTITDLIDALPDAGEAPTFAEFNLSPETTKSMAEMGFTSPTPIQQQALPLLLGDSHDFIGLASTGTGKTAAFGIPLVERIDASTKNTQALVLSPTRELALQVADQLTKLGKYKGVRVVTIYGGASYRTQQEGIKRGAHVIVATPGRLVDFISQKMAKLDNVETVVLDEADEMISMGFKDDLEMILKATHKEESSSSRAACKTWLFSATMSSDIRRVADTYLESPATVQINKVGGGVSATVEQVYYTVKNSNKTEVIGRILQTLPQFYGIIFCQTKMEVVELADNLNRRGFMADSLHGDRNQREREVTLKKFRNREVQVIVATDVAARGLDIKDLTHVVNHSLPWDTESYVHRIGRTARNGMKGVAISLVNPEQLRSLRRIQMQTKAQMTKGKIPTGDDVALLKVKEVHEIVTGLKADSQVLKRAMKLTADQAFDLESLSKEELLARVVAAYYPEAFSMKNEVSLDYVGDRIPQELMPNQGGGRSRPPVGASSRGGGDRRGGGYRDRDRGGWGDRGDRGPRRDFDRPRREDSDFAPRAPRAESGDEASFRSRAKVDRAPGREFGARGDSERPRRDRDFAPRGDSERAPRRDFGGGNRSEGERSERPPRREFGRDFDRGSDRSDSPRKSAGPYSGGAKPARRREDPKGVTRYRAGSKRKSTDS